jgi:hypothetical protein
MHKTMISWATAVLLGIGCNHVVDDSAEEPLGVGETVIEDSLYRATLTDLDGDARPDVMTLERKFPTSYGSKEPRIQYFVKEGNLPQTPTLQSGEVVHLVRAEFFNDYSGLFAPSNENVLMTYR